MRARYVSTRSAQDLAQLFHAAQWPTTEALAPSWNIAPTHEVWAVLERAPRDDGGAAAPLRELRALRWGLVPSWAKEPKAGTLMINARVETDYEKPADFALDAASQNIGSLPHEAAGWLSNAYAGLHRGTLPPHRRRNLRVLIWQILTQPWVTTSLLPFVLAGLRTGMDAVADSDASLRTALAQYYGPLVDELGHITAAGVLMSLFTLTDEKDKAAAARTVLTLPGR
ncbi:SOS response-associated peptidase family protein [Streptomyces olivaceoviridis]|uniref:SOS response-associated peptidase family protein n=1 Tax=Streptomyces olivaceoviridis TaxID=1921 RepID=UPI001677617B|nr:SOS response-associated peptidase family protein [Streptomyces olivaceoviridis]